MLVSSDEIDDIIYEIRAMKEQLSELDIQLEKLKKLQLDIQLAINKLILNYNIFREIISILEQNNCIGYWSSKLTDINTIKITEVKK